MSDNNSKSVRAVEQEVEHTRAQVSATLDELRNKMAPGAVVDSVFGYAAENGGADFMRTFGHQVRANPLPVALIGAGIAWLAVSSNRPQRKDHTMTNHQPPNNAPPVRDSRTHSPSATSNPALPSGSQRGGALDGMAATASASASGIASSARSTMSSVGDSVATAYGTVADAAHDIGSRVADGATAASDAARSGYQAVQQQYQRSGGLIDILKEQPLVTLALGVAIGAAIGAALPATETENEYLGPASDSARERVSELASDQYANAQRTASDAFDAVRSEAQAQGLTSDKPTEMLKGIGDKIGAVAGAAKSAVSEGVDRSSKTMTSALDEPFGSGASKG